MRFSGRARWFTPGVGGRLTLAHLGYPNRRNPDVGWGEHCGFNALGGRGKEGRASHRPRRRLSPAAVVRPQVAPDQSALAASSTAWAWPATFTLRQMRLMTPSLIRKVERSMPIYSRP